MARSSHRVLSGRVADALSHRYSPDQRLALAVWCSRISWLAPCAWSSHNQRLARNTLVLSPHSARTYSLVLSRLSAALTDSGALKRDGSLHHFGALSKYGSLPFFGALGILARSSSWFSLAHRLRSIKLVLSRSLARSSNLVLSATTGSLKQRGALSLYGSEEIDLLCRLR
jgi:hypothetical protein